jgi:hypothetical protein
VRTVAAGALGVGLCAGAGALGWVGLVTGAVPLDLDVGRTLRPLGPQEYEIAAPRDAVFDLLEQPYLGRQTRAMADKIEVIERGTDMVLAAHRTPVGRGLVATTLETIRFTRPDRVDFYLTRGPVPHAVEAFVLTDLEIGGTTGTRLIYSGELGTDLWAVGAWWGRVAARPWERTVRESLTAVKAEAERRHRL